MRIPDPIANTTTEAYLAYKAGVLSEGDLKPKLYDPYIHLDAWLAYWAGLVNTYPVDKNNDPEMLTDEEALIAYLSGVTNTYPEEFRDPADVRVAAYLKYLVSARWGRPEYPVTNEELYLSMMKTAVVTNDTPSSDIELDNTCEAPFEDVKMYGDTSQQTYTGKNLLRFVPRSTTQQGLTTTYDSGTGAIHVSGTTTATYSDISERVYEELPAGTYTFSVSSSQSQMNININLRTYYADGTYTNQSISTGSTSTTFTVSKAITSYYAYIWNNSWSSTSINVTFTLQIESGSSASSFEPYVGGVPAPNPSYPQPVQVVTGENTVQITGKNILKVASGSGTQNQSTITINNGSINYTASASGVSYAAFGIDGSSIRGTNYGDYVAWGGSKLGPGTYTLSVRYISGSTTTVAGSGGNFLDIIVYGREVGSTGRVSTQLAKASVNITDQTATFTLTEEKEVNIVSYMYANTPSININFNVQLEFGSATTYEPYQGQSYEVNLGKNLFQPDSGTYTNNGADTIEQADGTLKISGTLSATYFNICGNKYAALSGEYTFSRTNAALYGEVRLRVVYKDGTSENFGLAKGVSSTTFTISKPTERWYLWISGQTTGASFDYTSGFQLEKGSQATSYAPYFTPIELCKIGDYQDYIYEDEGEWKIHKAINYLQLTGSESDYITRTNTSATHSKFRIASQVLSGSIATPTSIFCSHFIANEGANDAEYSQTAICGSTTAGYQSQLWFSVANSIATTANGFKTWVTNNRPYLYYALATATDTEITNTALIDQLNALKAGGSYNEKTYIKITATDPNLPALLKVEAYKYD